jgi:hypothetical protein
MKLTIYPGPGLKVMASGRVQLNPEYALGADTNTEVTPTMIKGVKTRQQTLLKSKAFHDS